MSGLFRVCFFICVTESSFTVSYQMQRASSIVVLVCYVSRHDNEIVFMCGKVMQGTQLSTE